MIVRMTALALLILLSLLAPACERAEAPLAPASAGPNPGGAASLPRAKVWSPAPSYLEWLYLEPSDYTYEIAFRGTIDVAAGGVLNGFPLTWGRAYWFQMVVPPGSIVPPDPGATSVTITCYVPVLDTWFPTTDDPMPLVFEPDGLQFTTPALVTLCYHPHLVPSCLGYTFLSADYNAVSGTYYSLEVCQTGAAQSLDKRAAPPQPIPIEDEPNPCAVSIPAAMNHFSRWALGKENPDGP